MKSGLNICKSLFCNTINNQKSTIKIQQSKIKNLFTFADSFNEESR